MRSVKDEQTMARILSILTTVLLLGWRAVSAASDPTETNKPQTLPPCVHLIFQGKQYSVTYAGYACPHQGYEPLPATNYDQLASWVNDLAHYKILPQMDDYRLNARLATLDDRGKRGFSFNLDAFGYWSDYKWEEHTMNLFYGLVDVLGVDDARLVRLLEQPLVEKGLAKLSKTPEMPLAFWNPPRLSTSKRRILTAILMNAERELFAVPELLTVSTSLDEQARRAPTEAFREARRKHFGEFQIMDERNTDEENAPNQAVEAIGDPRPPQPHR